MGTDNPLSGTTTTKAEVLQKFRNMANAKPGETKPHLEHVIVEGNMAVAEFKNAMSSKGGSNEVMEACWVCRFEGEKIVEVRAYMDSALTSRIFAENK